MLYSSFQWRNVFHLLFHVFVEPPVSSSCSLRLLILLHAWAQITQTIGFARYITAYLFCSKYPNITLFLPCRGHNHRTSFDNKNNKAPRWNAKKQQRKNLAKLTRLLFFIFRFHSCESPLWWSCFYRSLYKVIKILGWK